MNNIFDRFADHVVKKQLPRLLNPPRGGYELYAHVMSGKSFFWSFLNYKRLGIKGIIDDWTEQFYKVTRPIDKDKSPDTDLEAGLISLEKYKDDLEVWAKHYGWHRAYPRYWIKPQALDRVNSRKYGLDNVEVYQINLERLVVGKSVSVSHGTMPLEGLNTDDNVLVHTLYLTDYTHKHRLESYINDIHPEIYQSETFGQYKPF
jgi:hypothetical protein